MDLTKYRNLFLEEATELLGELSRSLLALEKEPDCGEAIEAAFRAAHSIKSMAASLGYDAISELAHRLEDCMETVRSAGRVDGSAGLPLLFRGLESLERMVAVVRETGEAPAEGDAELLRALSAEPETAARTAPPDESTSRKKAPGAPGR